MHASTILDKKQGLVSKKAVNLLPFEDADITMATLEMSMMDAQRLHLQLNVVGWHV